MYTRLSATSWASQILSKSDRGMGLLAPSQSGGDDGIETCLAGAGILEVMG